MSYPTLPRVLRLICFATLSLAIAQNAVGASLPFTQLHEKPAIALPKVSSDGKRLAFRAEIDGVQYLALMDLATEHMDLVAKLETMRIENLFWKGNDSLVLIVEAPSGASEFRSVDLKTGKVTSFSDHAFFQSAELLCSLVGEPDWVILQIWDRGLTLNRFNIRTGKLVVLKDASTEASRWFVDRQGNPVAALVQKDKKNFLQWRPNPAAAWQLKELGLSDAPGLIPFAVHPDQKRLLAQDMSGPTTAAIVVLDPATMAKETVFQHPEFDVQASAERYWSDDPSAVFGFAYEDSRPRVHFIDQDAAQLQAELDKALPDTFNDIRSSSADHAVVAVLASSDRNPGMNYIYDRRAKHLIQFGPSFVNCDPQQMGSSRPFTFKSRDGLTVHGRLLLPPGNPVRPPVLVKVGPDLAGPRSSFGIDLPLQLFATRGYAVVQIDYRGCAGFGRAFVTAGDYQFGTGMVDDILGGIDFLVQEGLVDGDRVGLLTSREGGLAGLQTLIRSNRFKVWINDNTNLLETRVQLSELALTPTKQEKDIIADFGSSAAAKNYLRSIDPKNALTKIKLPSFHLYISWEGNSLGENADLVEKYLKMPAEQRVIISFEQPYRKKPSYAEEYNAYGRMFEFLQRWLASPGK